MSLHARQVAASAGAEGELIEQIAQRMVLEGTIGIEQARNLFKELGGSHPSEEG
jgi:hydroxymethylglutaryl-CoA reductase